MSLNVAFLAVLGVLIVCTCIERCVKIIFIKSQAIPQPQVDLAPLQAEIDKMKADHELVMKVGEETKKLLSNANLAAGLTPRGHR